MTAQQQHSPNHLFHIPPFAATNVDVDKELLQWAHDEIRKDNSFESEMISKKRSRQFIEEGTDTIEQESLSPPPEKSPRKNDDISQVQEEESEFRLIDASKVNHKDMLLAYKRIWNNLDLSKPTDAKLEPFVWHKIRQYQQINK